MRTLLLQVNSKFCGTAKNKDKFPYIAEYLFTGIHIHSHKQSCPTPLLFKAGEFVLNTKRQLSIEIFEPTVQIYPRYRTNGIKVLLRNYPRRSNESLLPWLAK